LSGTIIVARDLAHSKIRALIEEGKEIPDYFKNYPIYYAGPAKTPKGMASGAFGPTTAGRMDSYVEQFQSLGASLIMLAKGNRSAVVRQACQKYGGFYLCSIGGSAARLAQDCITSIETVDFPELGMEAVRKITVKDFPAFIVIDNKGNDFFKELKLS
jgi:fumarate hydratase class I